MREEDLRVVQGGVRRPGRPPASESRQRRAELIKAAIAVFGRDGFAGASLAAIAAEAGVTTAVVYYHFKDKEALFIETYSSTVSRLWSELATRAQELGNDSSLADRIDATFDGSVTVPSTERSFLLRANVDITVHPELQHLGDVRDRMREKTLRAVLGDQTTSETLRILELVYAGWTYESAFRPEQRHPLRDTARAMALTLLSETE